MRHGAARNGGPVAYVESAARYGDGCAVYPYAMVGMQPMPSPVLARQPAEQLPAIIGDRVTIGPYVLIYAGAVIGDDCFIGNHASIREGARLGARCVVGRNVTINYDAVIGDDVKLQDGTHITGGCVVGDGCFIGVNVTTSNDKRREIVDYEFVGVTPPIIGARCLIGSGACIVPGVRIGDGAIVGAGALVTKDVPAGSRVLGTPAVVSRSEKDIAASRAQACATLELAQAQNEGLAHRWGRA